MKRIIAASLSLMVASAFVAPGAAAQSHRPSTAPSTALSGTTSPRTSTTEPTSTTSTPAPTKTTSSTTTSTSEAPGSSERRPARRDVIPVPVFDHGKFDTDYVAQVSYVHVPTGFRVDSDNADELRSCLSICKVFIAECYGLEHTTGARTWGKSTTTMHDVTTFLAAKVEAGDFDDPVLAALASPASIAADGYAQDFGTDVLPGVIGTKRGWADERNTMNASDSYGEDFAVALNVLGDAATATEVAEELFTPAPRGDFVVENGRLVPAPAEPRQTAAASADGSSDSAGNWVAGALLVATAVGVVWTLRGRKR